MNDDGEFGSGSSDASSIDPSQLMGDWQPDAILRVENEKESATKPPGAMDAASTESAPAERIRSETKESPEESNLSSVTKIKTVFGESVLEWQRQKRSISSASEPSPTKGTSKYVTLRDSHNSTTAGPIANNAKITVTPPIATITSGEKEYTGKYASLSSSLSNPWVECVAIYNKDRKAHILEMVDWTVTNLKPTSEPLPASVTLTTDPRQQQRNAEERVRDKRKHKATTSSAKTPTKKAKQSPFTPGDTTTTTTTTTTPDTNEQPSDESPKTKYRGVTALKRKKGTRYRCQITLNGKTAYLGTFATAEEAARRYDQEARKKGDTDHLNFPENEPANVAGDRDKATSS